MITRLAYRWALLAGLLLAALIARNGSEAMFFIFDAVAWCIGLALIVELTSGKMRIVATGIFLLTVSNLCDELFFDPMTTGWNEILFAFVVVGYVTFKIFNKPSVDSG